MSKVLGFLVVVVPLVLQACGTGTTNRQSNFKKTLVYAEALQTNTFDPHRQNTGELVYGTQVYQALIRFDPNNPNTKGQNGIIPQLARSWAVNSDATVYTFDLVKNAVFSTGNPVTADDVKFSLERLWNIQSPLSNVMQGYKSIEAVDTHTVRITMQAPDAAYLMKLTGPQVMIVDSKVAKEHGALSDPSAIKNDTAKAWFDQPNSIGSGPYLYESFVPNDRVILKRNPKYWGKPALTDRVIVQGVPDIATQRQLLERGAIDIATGLDFQTAAQMEKQNGISIVYAKGNTNLSILFMTASPEISKPLSNKLVRQAVARSIDYKGLLALFNGHGVHPATSIPDGLLGCCGIPQFTENLDQAKQLLAQAGYPNGFEVTFSYGSGLSGGVDIATIATKIQSDLARLGIKLNMQPLGTQFLAAYRAAILSMGISGIGGVSDPDAFVGDIWDSRHNFVTKRLHFQDPAIDQLYPKSLATTGPAREAVYKQLAQMFQDQAVVLPLVQADAILSSTTKVSGYRFLPENVATDFSSISVRN